MTITIYGLECQSTKKARQWFKNNEIPFKERNMLKKPLTVDELRGILRLTLDGTDGIVATRSKIYKELNLNLEDLSLQELLEIIHEHPKLLKSPMIVDENKLQTGFNEEEIRQFLPRQTRKTQWLHMRRNHFNLMGC